MISMGVIGGGGISNTHARAATEVEGVRVAAFYGTNREKVEQLGRTFGAKAYDDFKLFLDHKPMDAVIIGTPSGLHAQEGIECARHGLHVLVEKPIDITTAKSDALIKECELHKVKLAV